MEKRMKLSEGEMEFLREVRKLNEEGRKLLLETAMEFENKHSANQRTGERGK